MIAPKKSWSAVWKHLQTPWKLQAVASRSEYEARGTCWGGTLSLSKWRQCRQGDHQNCDEISKRWLLGALLPLWRRPLQMEGFSSSCLDGPCQVSSFLCTIIQVGRYTKLALQALSWVLFSAGKERDTIHHREQPYANQSSSKILGECFSNPPTKLDYLCHLYRHHPFPSSRKNQPDLPVSPPGHLSWRWDLRSWPRPGSTTSLWTSTLTRWSLWKRAN